MLRTALIELINSGNMWAFIGSGISVDSGCPTWKGLVEGTVANLDETLQVSIKGDLRYVSALDGGKYEKCFARIEHHAGRVLLEGGIKNQLRSVSRPGRLAHLLADWPFAGYITTNYDRLLETALIQLHKRGWTSVGNTPDEVRKLAGDPTRVIWHVHGSIELPSERSRLTLTDRDYDDLYLETSPMITQLKGLLAQRRVVFVGFGFKDPEVMRLLRLMGRLCSPARPAFAFVSGLFETDSEVGPTELLEKYNVDVIPYDVKDGSHKKLSELLEDYGALILRRSQRFGQPARPCPSYDPETTGLLLYNQFSLRGEAHVTEDVVGALLETRILSLLKHQGPRSVEALVEDLRERVAIISTQPVSSLDHHHEIERALKELVRTGHVNVSRNLADQETASLTPKGSEIVNMQAATAQRLSDQFSASLESRAHERSPNNPEVVMRVAKAAESFLKECVQRRALGVAMILFAPRPGQQSYHTVALLQALPDFMAQLLSAHEARALIHLVQDILRDPSQAESEYLGLSLQAQFGVHLLGYDPDTLRARAREIAKTVFLIDSSSLITFLARSSLGYYSARLLIDQLRAVGAVVATTTMLANEVAEHARWPIDSRVVSDTGHFTVETIRAAKGSAGYRPNEFLEGSLAEASQGKIVLSYLAYLESVCGCKVEQGVSDEAFYRAIENTNVYLFKFGDWEGFDQSTWAERDDLQHKIAQRRQASNTFRHERQVKAEAEALIIVRDLRNRSLRLDGQDFSDAYFVSHTRAIDEVAGPETSITMRPEAVLQWLTTIRPCSVEELGYLVNSLLWELSVRNLAIVDTRRLQTVFSPLIAASKERLDEELESHRVLISDRYGEGGEQAFRETDDLDLPVVMHSYYVQKAEELEISLAAERKMREQAQRRAALSDAERRELEKFRAKRSEKRRKEKKRKRAAAARAGKRRKKK